MYDTVTYATVTRQIVKTTEVTRRHMINRHFRRYVFLGIGTVWICTIIVVSYFKHVAHTVKD